MNEILRKVKQILKIKLLIMKGVRISNDCRITGKVDFGSEPYLIYIGKKVTIADGVRFITHDGGNWIFRHDDKYEKVNNFGNIIVHDNCFIGADSIILPGITIGPNSVVGAGAVVTKNVPERSVVAGNPARVITDIQTYYMNNLKKTIKAPDGKFKWKEILENHFWNNLKG
ncbi:acyltransferase [Sporomusa sphaeroides]|uniref:acyltransferase n=1 Tax=Sporomusa sphaeroides TaxID=47679 RepID=UPI002BD43205|nr:acyltransferase [Sporomusa sphaeroides]HML34175.1 acyltransferase [Sporomusa sphaeroides]